MNKIPKEALFIIDGSYLLYRSFYALKPLYTSTGIPTQATYGFCRAIKKLIDDFEPQRLVVAWDTKGKNMRHALYAEYKATRQAPPCDLFTQKQDILEFLNLAKIPCVMQEGFEADDLIYSLVQDHKKRPIILVCPDKDLFQLLESNVTVFDPFKNRLIDQETYEQEQGILVKKISFYYALLGDSSDNIPGVNGIGQKTAKELVNQFDSLDDLYENLDKVKKDRVRNLLTEQKDQALLSFKLFTLHYFELEKQDFDYDKKNWLHAAPLFKRLEFTSLYKDVAKDISVGQMSLFAQQDETGQPVKLEAKSWACFIVETQEGLEALINVLKKADEFALDTETMGLSPLQDSIVGISFAVNDHEAYYIPLAHTGEGHENQLDKKATLNALKPILEDQKKLKHLHNAKFDSLVLSQYDIDLGANIWDTCLAANLVKNEWQKVNLKDLSLFFLHEPMDKFKEVMGTTYKTFSQVPLEPAGRYAAHDALQTYKLKKILEVKLREYEKLQALFADIDMPCSYVLTQLEKTGITLDIDILSEVGRDVITELTHIEKKLFAAIEQQQDIAGSGINLNSPKQIEILLFDQLKLPVVKKSSKGQRSTDHEVLQELSKIHPVPALILRHRELSKLKSTYVEPLPTFINPKTGKIHTSYNQILVATGRLSSMDPNLQNIPAGEGLGIKIRSAFVASHGQHFLSADYSQIELRVLAHMTKDTNLTNAFLHNKDVHAQTAAQLFDVALEDVSHEQRQLGKRINFSIIYGMTSYGLSKDLGIKPSEAKIYIEKYFAQYKQVAEWIEQIVSEAQERGYVETEWGRRRHVPELREKNKNLWEAGKRIAVNTPVQGTAADIMKLAMIHVYKKIEQENLMSKIILQIHDELIIQVPDDELEQIQKLVQHEMESVINWEVPLKVSLRTGKNWEEVTK